MAAAATHNVTGKVVNATTRSFTSKAGKAIQKTVLNLDNGISIELNGFGDKTARNPPGTIADFSVAEAYGRWEVVGARQLGLAELGGTASPAGSSGSSRGEAPPKMASRGSFPIKGDDYQVSIIRQNSLTNAVATIMPMIGDNGYMTGPDMDPLAVAEMIEKVSDKIIRLAYKYAAFSTGNLDTQAVQEVVDKTLGATKAV